MGALAQRTGNQWKSPFPAHRSGGTHPPLEKTAISFKQHPLVLFLHGSSGSGTDNVKQLDRANWFGSLAWALPENQERHPRFVVAPQSDVNWPAVRLIEGQLPEILPIPGLGGRMAIEIVESIADELPVDRSRIYVTGHSMGGAGTWHVLAQRPDLFAAGVPVCGRADLATLPKLKKVPIWNFHGATDDIESVETSRLIIATLRKAGGSPLSSNGSSINTAEEMPFDLLLMYNRQNLISGDL